MRKFLQRLFRKPIIWIANRLSSSPRREAVFKSLSSLYAGVLQTGSDKGPVIPFELNSGKFVLVSDQHKGTRDLADDFRLAEKNYLAAMDYYYQNGYTLINIGDCEELWENNPTDVLKKNTEVMMAEARFNENDRYYRLYGNHDLEWKYLVPLNLYLRPALGTKLKAYEGMALETAYDGDTYTIFLSHGHQGDQRSDGNAFSMWVVAAIWTPIQRFFQISIDTISDSFELVDKHNIIMYEWSATQNKTIFISGHTHKPVFASLDHIDRIGKEIENAKERGNTDRVAVLEQELEKRKKEYAGKQFSKTMAVPSYFNTGCCCFEDGDITAIEICDGEIRLVKWEQKDSNTPPSRKTLEHASLGYIFENLKK